MFTRSKVVADVRIIVEVQLIAVGIAASVVFFITFSHSHLHSSAVMNQDYQPSITIGSPKFSQGSGTR